MVNQRLQNDAKAASEVRAAHDAWLEKITAELLGSGVSREDIGVHFNSNLRTVVTVRGERVDEFDPPV